MIKISRGLDLPITGKPEQRIEAGNSVSTVALLGPDYIGMRPTMMVAEGDQVRVGQPIFSDKKNEGVLFTAPVAGEIKAIHRGPKRSLISVVIGIAGDEQLPLSSFDPSSARREDIVSGLVQAGLWPALRTRPFNRTPPLAAVPHSIFVTAVDTAPLAVDPRVVIAEEPENFALGQDVLAKLTAGPVFVCQGAGADLPKGKATNIRLETFVGPHPAGLPGTHIHFLDPVGPNKSVWFVNYQDVIAFGMLARQGKLHSQRVVAVGGPCVKRPRLLRAPLGAAVGDLIANELTQAEASCRVIAGSVYTGHVAKGSLGYLGRYQQQVSVIAEDRSRQLLGYLMPGADRHSVMPVYLSKLTNKLFPMTTSTNGSPRAMVPVGAYERVMPLDILPTQLLRYLLVGDIDRAIALGCLELDEEDLALCTYACPGKYEYGPVLRRMLDDIAKEG